MTITSGQLLDAIKHRIGGPVDAELGGGIRILNLAGRHFYNMHSWRAALVTGASLNYVANQNYCTLPTGFGELIGCEVADNALLRPVYRIGIEEMLKLRNINPGYFGFITHVCVESQTKLGVYPTPTASATAALQIAYLSRWADVTGDNVTIGVADFAEGLLMHVVREYAAGMVIGDLDDRLNAIRQGTLFDDTIRQDGIQQRIHGKLLGGAASVSGPGDAWDWARGANASIT